MEKEKTKFGKFLQKVGNTFGDVADVGESLLGGTVAGSALGVLGDILEGKANSADLTPEERTAAQNFKRELERDRMQFEQELVRMEAEDLKSARESNVALQTDPDSTVLAKVVPYAIDIVIMLTWVGATFYIASNVFQGVDVSDGIWGLYSTVTGLATNIVGFHRGSSMGSKRKDLKLKL